jgi:hypothetical protein
MGQGYRLAKAPRGGAGSAALAPRIENGGSSGRRSKFATLAYATTFAESSRSADPRQEKKRRTDITMERLEMPPSTDR